MKSHEETMCKIQNAQERIVEKKFDKLYSLYADSKSQFTHCSVTFKPDMEKLSKTDCERMSTDKLKVFAAYIGKDIASLNYGYIIGFFSADNQIYQFIHRIHRPRQSNQMANTMTTLYNIKVIEINDKDEILRINAHYGYMAFWANTSMDMLRLCGDAESIALRELMNNIAKYSREENYIAYFRKIERRKCNQAYVQAHSTRK